MKPMAILSTALVAALAMAPAAVAWAQQEVNGRIDYIEPGSRTLYFNDGRIVTLEPGATLWVDGRQLPMETLRRGMNVVVRDNNASGAQLSQGQPTAPSGSMSSTGRAPSAVPGHPMVSASGTVAKVDSDQGIVTFQDGRTLKVDTGSQVWEESNLNDIHPGDQVLLRNAQPAGYSGMSNMSPDRMRMGQIIGVDRARSMVLLDDGSWIRVAPTTRMRLNGRDAKTELVPGDELIVVTPGPQPQGASQSQVPGRDQIGAVQPRASGQPQVQRGPQDQQAGQSPSALSREAIEQGAPVQADEIHIFRRRQSP